MFQGGTQQISENLLKKIGIENIKLSHPVVNIAQSIDGVDVRTLNGETFRGNRAVVSIPPNLIRKIEFSPPLPSIKQFIYDHQPIGHLIKYIVTYKRVRVFYYVSLENLYVCLNLS